MKRSIVLLTVTAVLMATLMLILSIASAGAVPVQETAAGPVQLLVNIRYDYAYVRSDPNLPAQITVKDSSGTVKATVSGTTNEIGTFGSWHGTWTPEHPDIEPGDKVMGDVDGTTADIDPVGQISGKLDLDADTIEGTVTAPWFAPAAIEVKCVTYSDTENGPEITVSGINPDGGSFVCDYGSLPWDMTGDWYYEISYIEPDGDEVQSEPILPWVRVNMDHEWVGADYPAGHMFDITLKDSDGATKATATAESVPGGGWEGDGFHTDHDAWTPMDFDIVPGDVVHVVSDDGYENEVKVGAIYCDIDLVLNGVSGDILVPWLSGELPIECHPWGAPGDWPGVQESSSMADGSGQYECFWDPVDWDVQPGQDIGVMYREPDNDRVIAVFSDPAPDMRVEKWPSGGSQEVAPDGPAIFTIRYRNEGDAPAATVTLTDTLPAGTTFVSDSSGVIPTVSSGEVVWEFGPVEADHKDNEFHLVLEHTGTVSDTLTNIVDIFTEFDPHDNNDHAETEVHVSDGQPDLYVDKNRQSDNPVPGGTVLYEINYGNNGPIPSGHTTFTDTLPANTTVVDWYSRDGYDLWTGGVNNGQLVLEAPAVPAYWGDAIMLRLEVAPDVPVDTELVNEVVIFTANDSNPDDNMSTEWAYVGDPFWNIRIQKEARWGSLVPGGYVQYMLEISNDGNMPVDAEIIDTMPDGTTYLETQDYDDPVIDNGQLIWDIGEMLPGERQYIHFSLAIEDTVEPETVLKNCAEAVMVGHEDDDPENNTQCVEDMVHEAGPNFRVFKNSWWEGGNSENIHYTIWVGNTGTTQLQDVVVTDTYPEGTTFNGDWWAWWGDLGFEHNAGTREIKWTLPYMNPGDFLHINFTVDLDGNLIGEQGLTYVNLVEAPLTGDVYPADNQYEETTYSGAEMYVKKWLSDGLPLPGETVTFTVEFGNAQNSWETDEIWLEDLMPDGLLFIKATTPWDSNETWNPDMVSGKTYAWEWGHLWSGAQVQFEIVAQIEDDVAPGATLTNMIEIYSDNPDEIDPVPENNSDTADVNLPRIYLPVIFTPAVE